MDEGETKRQVVAPASAVSRLPPRLFSAAFFFAYKPLGSATSFVTSQACVSTYPVLTAVPNQPRLQLRRLKQRGEGASLFLPCSAVRLTQQRACPPLPPPVLHSLQRPFLGRHQTCMHIPYSLLGYSLHAQYTADPIHQTYIYPYAKDYDSRERTSMHAYGASSAAPGGAVFACKETQREPKTEYPQMQV